MNSTPPRAPTRRALRISRVGRLPRWQRLATYAVLVFCALSGLLFFMAHDVDMHVTGLASHILLMLHGVSAQAALLTVGAVMPIHIRQAWNARRNRTTGVLTMRSTVHNQRGELVMEGMQKYLLMKRPAAA